MPRIRSIKPEFWGDEKMAALDPATRLVFLGLISLADDAGRLVDNVKTIDGFIFSETDDSARECIEVLVRLGRILRYRSASGQKLIQVANWSRHQKVDNPNKYTLPGPAGEPQATQALPKPSRGSSETVETTARDPHVTISDQRSATNDQRSPTIDQRAGAAALGNGRFARVQESLPEEHREALAGLIRSCRSPDALLAELEAIASGMRPMNPRPSWAHIGQAVSDLVLNGERPTAILVRTYVQRLAKGDNKPSATGVNSTPLRRLV